MRKCVLVLVLALVLPAAATAKPGDRGDGTFAVKGATGRLVLNARGTALGKVEGGQLVVVDLSATGSVDVEVRGADRTVMRPNGSTVYTGAKLKFRIVGTGKDGWYSATITGSAVNLSAVGRGTVQGQGISEGFFSTDGLPFRTVPAASYYDSFGQQ